MAEAGFPPGVVNLVTGHRRRGRRRDRREPRLAVISFTGSSGRASASPTEAGRAAQARLAWSSAARTASSSSPMPTSTSPPTGSCGRAFGTTGQRCTACSRVIVERAVVEPLLERLEARARKLRLGPGLDETTDVGPLINAGRRRQGRRRYMGIGRAEGELVIGGGRATRRRPRARPLLRADDLQRRPADGPDRPGGDLRAGPLGHPGRRLRRGDARRSTRPATGSRRRIFTQRREPRLPGDARLRDRHRLRERRARPAPRRTCRSAAGRRPATATARPATRRSTRSPSGSRSTSTSAAASSGPRSTTSRADPTRVGFRAMTDHAQRPRDRPGPSASRAGARAIAGRSSASGSSRTIGLFVASLAAGGTDSAGRRLERHERSQYESGRAYERLRRRRGHDRTPSQSVPRWSSAPDGGTVDDPAVGGRDRATSSRASARCTSTVDGADRSRRSTELVDPLDGAAAAPASSRRTGPPSGSPPASPATATALDAAARRRSRPSSTSCAPTTRSCAIHALNNTLANDEIQELVNGGPRLRRSGSRSR